MWEYVEADFRRDYGIRLTDELPAMDWREFITLYNGLSPYGAVATHYEDALKRQREQNKTQDDARIEAASFWTRVASI